MKLHTGDYVPPPVRGNTRTYPYYAACTFANGYQPVENLDGIRLGVSTSKTRPLPKDLSTTCQGGMWRDSSPTSDELEGLVT